MRIYLQFKQCLPKTGLMLSNFSYHTTFDYKPKCDQQKCVTHSDRGMCAYVCMCERQAWYVLIWKQDCNKILRMLSEDMLPWLCQIVPKLLSNPFGQCKLSSIKTMIWVVCYRYCCIEQEKTAIRKLSTLISQYLCMIELNRRLLYSKELYPSQLL